MFCLKFDLGDFNMTDRLYAIDVIKLAMPTSSDPALYDLGTRSAYLRGFEEMRAKALNAVNPKDRYGALEPKDYKWNDKVNTGE